MKRPPFKMVGSRGASLTRDGKHIVSGRASFVWEQFLLNRASGVPGEYKIRANHPNAPRGERPWHRLDWTPEEAEEMILAWSPPWSGPKKIARMHKLRAARQERGLPVG
jgi:hypothetical protein